MLPSQIWNITSQASVLLKKNVRVIDFHENWNVLLYIYIKLIMIKELKPILNKILKAPKQLVFFNILGLINCF